MKKFRVPMVFREYYHVEVEANTAEEAYDQAIYLAQSGGPLREDGGEHEVFYDDIEEIDG